MAVAVHKRAVGDTLTKLKRQLVQLGDNGTYEAVNLASKTVFFFMEDEDGNDVIGPGTSSANDCTVDEASTGKVSYDFANADVDERGTYYGYFKVYDAAGECDTYPAEEKTLKIILY